MTRRAAVLGASGFVGTAVCVELALRDWDVTTVRTCSFRAERHQSHGAPRERAEIIERLTVALEGVDAVVNTAGVARPTGRDLRDMTAANAMLPRLIAEACVLAGVRRLVHVSSAAVQGDLCRLDESANYRADSPYAQSKMLGEQALLATPMARTPGCTVILRPTSVHGANRAVTRRLIRLGRWPLACVIAPGLSPTPQVLVDNVGAAAEYLCRAHLTPPPIVLQPWEGWTTGGFLQLLSGRWPCQIQPTAGDRILQLTRPLCRRGTTRLPTGGDWNCSGVARLKSAGGSPRLASRLRTDETTGIASCGTSAVTPAEDRPGHPVVQPRGRTGSRPRRAGTGLGQPRPQHHGRHRLP